VSVTVLPAPVPTPVLAFSVRELGATAGIMVTASHNPGPDNGYKVYDDQGRQIDEEQASTIASAMTAAGRVTELPLAGAGHPLIEHVGTDIIDVYLSTVVQDLLHHRAGRARVPVAHTALHGVGAEVVRRACRLVGYIDLHEVAEQSVPDPDFPTVRFPNPEEPGALDLLLDHAARTGAVVALANDPDADRLAMAVPDPALGPRSEPSGWRALTGNELGWLLADHLLRRGGYDPDGVLATTVVSSRMLRAMAEAAGVLYVETLTGFKWVSRAATPAHPMILGYEEALGYCIGQVVRDKDGISALLVASEMVSDLLDEGVTVLDRLDELARRHGVHATGQWSTRREGAAGAAAIAEAMRTVRADPPTELAGRPVLAATDLAAPGGRLPPADAVVLDLDGARVVVRPSGTEPKLKCYVEVVLPVVGDDLPAARRAADRACRDVEAALPAALGLDRP
jgi:phosphomannomutase